jgi:hypothetical protein
LLNKWRINEENRKIKKKIKLFIGKKMSLSSMNKNLVGVGDQLVGTKDFNILFL